jgi:hypothetical protein
MREIIQDGSRAVVIVSNDDTGPFSLRLWVNVARNQEPVGALRQGSATLVCGRRASLAGARRLAHQFLAE